MHVKYAFVVEVDTSHVIRQNISNPVLGRIINPVGHEYGYKVLVVFIGSLLSTNALGTSIAGDLRHLVARRRVAS